MCVCLSRASDSSKIITVIIVKLGNVTVSDMRMHQVLIILTLTFTQGHTDQNNKNNKCLIISETIQACCEDIPMKSLYDHHQSNDLALHSRSQLRLNLDNSFISWTVFKLWHSNLT